MRATECLQTCTALWAHAAALKRADIGQARQQQGGWTSAEKVCIKRIRQTVKYVSHPRSISLVGARRAGHACESNPHRREAAEKGCSTSAWCTATSCTHPCCSCVSRGRSGQPAAQPCEAAGKQAEQRRHSEKQSPGDGGSGGGGGGSKAGAGDAQGVSAHACMSCDSMRKPENATRSPSFLAGMHALYSPCCAASRVPP